MRNRLRATHLAYGGAGMCRLVGAIAVPIAMLLGGASAARAGPITYVSATRGLELQVWAAGSAVPPPQSLQVAHLGSLSESVTDAIAPCQDPATTLPVCTGSQTPSQLLSASVTQDSLLTDSIILFSGFTGAEDDCDYYGTGGLCAETNASGRSFLDVVFSLENAQSALFRVDGEDFLDFVPVELLDTGGATLMECAGGLCWGTLLAGDQPFGELFSVLLPAGSYRLRAESTMDWNFFSREYFGGPLDIMVAIPEPTSGPLLLLGLAALAGRRRRGARVLFASAGRSRSP